MISASQNSFVVTAVGEPAAGSPGVAEFDRATIGAAQFGTLPGEKAKFSITDPQLPEDHF
jgi:hypothetical protein